MQLHTEKSHFKIASKKRIPKLFRYFFSFPIYLGDDVIFEWYLVSKLCSDKKKYFLNFLIWF